MGNKLTFKDLSFENALDELTDKRHNKPGKDKYGYCRIIDTPVSRYEDFLWFNTIDEMKDHILNAWYPSCVEERDEEYYNDVDKLKQKLNDFPESRLNTEDLYWCFEHEIGWAGNIKDLLHENESIRQAYQASPELEAYIAQKPLPDKALEKLVEFLDGFFIGG